jgi:hypothetical protein
VLVRFKSTFESHQSDFDLEHLSRRWKPWPKVGRTSSKQADMVHVNIPASGRLAEEELGEVVQVVLPHLESVSAARDDVVDVRHVLVLEHLVYALADVEQRILVAAGDVQQRQLLGRGRVVLDEGGGRFGVWGRREAADPGRWRTSSLNSGSSHWSMALFSSQDPFLLTFFSCFAGDQSGDRSISWPEVGGDATSPVAPFSGGIGGIWPGRMVRSSFPSTKTSIPARVSGEGTAKLIGSWSATVASHQRTSS